MHATRRRHLSPTLLMLAAALAGAGFPPAAGGSGGFESARGAFFRPPVNVSHSLGQSRFARVSPRSLVLDAAGPLFAIWVEVLPHTEGIAHEMATSRYLAGAGWDSTFTPIWLWEGNPSTEPAAVLDRDRVLHLVWIEQQEGLRQIMGLRFGVASGMISAADAVSGPVRSVADPDVAVGPGGVVHVVWSEVESAAPRLRHRRFDPSTGWSTATTLATGPDQSAFSPAVASAGDGALTLAWQRTHGRAGVIACAELAPDGTLGPPTVASNERPGWFTGPPAIAVARSGAWVAWSETDGVESRVLARKKTRDGWQPIVTLSAPGAVAEHPSLAIDPWETLHAVWVERGAGDSAAGGAGGAGGDSGGGGTGGGVFYTSLALESGPTAALPRSLSVGGIGPFDGPIVAADPSGRVVVAWSDRGVGNGDIFVRQGVAGFSALPAPADEH